MSPVLELTLLCVLPFIVSVWLVLSIQRWLNKRNARRPLARQRYQEEGPEEEMMHVALAYYFTQDEPGEQR